MRLALAALALVASGCQTGPLPQAPAATDATTMASASSTSRPSATRTVRASTPEEEAQLPEPITFTKHIAPLVQRHCQECHRPGQVGPFPLVTYEDVHRRRAKIQKVVAAKRMPPWKPVPGFGDFLGARSLEPAEMAVIDRWVKTGAERGDIRDLPAPRTFADGPTLGAPDLELAVEKFTVAAGKNDIYRCLAVGDALPDTRYVTGMEFVPGNRKIVHHAIIYIDRTGRSVELDRRDPGPGYTCFGGPGFTSVGYAGGWSPGARPWVMPAGVGLLLPAGARLVVQMHYHNDGPTEETDASRVRLYFAKTPVERRVHLTRVLDRNLSIPSGASRHEMDITLPLDRPIEIIAIGPHMHLLGREIEVWAAQPDGAVIPLVYIDDWDFDWQGLYFYRKPVRLVKGARIHLKAVWDNSADNPRNPSRPPRLVTWGERTIDEMGHAVILYTTDEDRNNFGPLR